MSTTKRLRPDSPLTLRAHAAFNEEVDADRVRPRAAFVTAARSGAIRAMYHTPRHVFTFRPHDHIDFVRRLLYDVSPALPIENVAGADVRTKTAFELDYEGSTMFPKELTAAEAQLALDTCRDLIRLFPRANEIQHGAFTLQVSPDDAKCVRLTVELDDHVTHIALIGVGWQPYDAELSRFNAPRPKTKAFGYYGAFAKSGQ